MKNFIYLSILTAFVVLCWIIFSIVHNSTTSTISQDTGIIINPISPRFDLKTLDDMKQRKNLSVNLEEEITSGSAATPILTPLPKISPTPSIESSSSARVASPSGGVGL